LNQAIPQTRNYLAEQNKQEASVQHLPSFKTSPNFKPEPIGLHDKTPKHRKQNA
jgi:hypothetical protein